MNSTESPEVVTSSIPFVEANKLNVDEIEKMKLNCTDSELEMVNTVLATPSDNCSTTDEKPEEHAEHLNFCQRFILNDNLNQFTHWISTFRESPQVVTAVVQSYAAVLIARENRVAKMHEDFCKLITAKYNASTMWKVVREKCRTQTIQEYIKEKYENQRHSIDAWKEVLKAQQEEITKRVESMEVTKRLVEKQGMTQSQAVLMVIVTGILGTSGLFRIGRGSGLLIVNRRKLVLLGLCFAMYRYFAEIKKHFQSVGIAGYANQFRKLLALLPQPAVAEDN